MLIRKERIHKAQELMQAQGMAGIMIMNHDDYRYFLGIDRSQPRAIIPWRGDPVIIAFAGEEPELRQMFEKTVQIDTFMHVGEQIQRVTTQFRQMAEDWKQVFGEKDKPEVGMQLWFDTPAFLVEMFRRANPRINLVSSDPVLDQLRAVKEPDELHRLKEAQRIATIGMERARTLLMPGVSAKHIATEVIYDMMREGAEGTATPVYVNLGPETCMIHGWISSGSVKKGDLVVVDLTPQVGGYGANLSRTFVLGEPEEWQHALIETYREMIEATRQRLKPGATVRELDAIGKAICERHGFGDYHVDGIAHGIGLRFEEPPASTILRKHRNMELQEGMTLTIGHTILAIPGRGGVRHEDIYRVTPQGGEILTPYPIDPVV